MVIAAVEDGHPDVRPLEGPGCIEAAETSADDDDARLRQSEANLSRLGLAVILHFRAHEYGTQGDPIWWS